MKICENGRPKTAIFIRTGASEIEKFAARELRKYIWNISGAELAIKNHAGGKEKKGVFLFCGRAADQWCGNRRAISGCKNDSFLVRCAGERLLLLGQNGRGLLYAVYSFLEDELGVGFLAPGAENEWIPKQRAISLKPFFRLEEPAMQLRGFSCSISDEIDWMAKNKMNYVLADNMKPDVLKEAKKRQMLLYFADHSFYRWLPPEKYWKTHPEYYSLIDGKRVCTYQQDAHMGHQQICVSNPNVIRIVSENIVAYMQKHPEYDFYTLWPNDADAWCQCANCRKLDERGKNAKGAANNAGSYLYFANKVAENVAKHHPEKKLNIIAYRSTMAPPFRKKISLHPNLVVEFAYWGRPYDHPAGKPIGDGRIRKKMRRAGIGMQEFDGWKKHYLAYGRLLQRWNEITGGHILVYDYLMASQSTLSLPYPLFGTIQEDHKFYRQCGVVGGYMQAHKNNCNAYGLNYWLGAKAYWGGPQNVAKRLGEYCAKRYGPAAEPMEKYFQTLERAFRAQTASFWPYTVSRFLRPAVIEKCDLALAAARKLARRQPRQDWLIKTKLHFEYARRMKLFYDVCREADVYVERKDEHKALDATMRAYQATLELYAHIMQLKGKDILSTPRVVLYSLLKQQGKPCGDISLAAVEAGGKVADYLYPILYNKSGW